MNKWKILGALLMAAGVVAGLYVGVWLMFVGGILQIIAAAKDGWALTEIGIGIVRIMFAGFTGWVVAIVAIFPGFALFSCKK